MEGKDPHIDTLLEKCKQNDRTAQFELYRRYYKAMYNTAYRILNDAFEAEDVMQEAFLNAFEKLDMYRGEVAFGGWLKKIVINRSLTQLKKRKESVRFDQVAYKVEESAETDSAADEINYREMRTTEVMEALQSLKDNYRLVLTLSLIEGYDNEEIAQIMQISHQNCRTMISRAKNSLRKKLAQKNELKTDAL